MATIRAKYSTIEGILITFLEHDEEIAFDIPQAGVLTSGEDVATIGAKYCTSDEILIPPKLGEEIAFDIPQVKGFIITVEITDSQDVATIGAKYCITDPLKLCKKLAFSIPQVGDHRCTIHVHTDSQDAATIGAKYCTSDGILIPPKLGEEIAFIIPQASLPVSASG